MLCLIVKEGKKEMFLYPFLCFPAQVAKMNRGFSVGHCNDVGRWSCPLLVCSVSEMEFKK